MKKVLLLILFLLLSVAANTGELEAHEFSDFAVKKQYSGKVATVILATETEKMFRTRLSKTAEKEVNFAGEYVLTSWGCGSSCTVAAAVSLRTGQVSFMPGTICCNNSDHRTLDYQSASRLLITTGYINEGGIYGRHYYEINDNGFVYLKTEKLIEFSDKNPN
ncbi:MAG: hypothetical protein KJO69_00275 [Gammaproteobacteria bacterium]|nr:hypothetical protein [Gammaproteobacteria bacterium]NNJ72956.1 hypothetical protein [Enterobacterales bacterium]